MADEQPNAAAVFEKGVHVFMGLELEVSRGALIPRAETELLGGEAVRLLRELPHAPVVVDVCCGSGNLGCAVAHHLPTATVFAADLTPECAALTRRNVTRLGLSERVRVFQGDLFEPLRPELPAGGVDMIICNPPYISSGKLATDRAHLLANEPREAFDGGPYGLSVHQRVIKEAIALLKPGGHLLFEFGLGQDRQMKALFDRSKAWTGVRFVNNAEGAPRVVVAVRP